MRSLAAALGAVALLLAPAGAAIPPDARLGLPSRKPHLEKADLGFVAVEVDAPEVLRAELLPSGELLLEPQGPGVARVFLFAPRIVRVIEVAALVPLQPQGEVPLPPACGKPSEARIGSAACYHAWRARLSRTLSSDAPSIAFEDAGLFAQLKAAQAELTRSGLPQIVVAVTPFGVRLKGAKGEAERRRALRAIWSAFLGPLRLEG